MSAAAGTVLAAGLGLSAPAAHAAPCGDATYAFSGGDGTADAPFLISTEADLADLRDAMGHTPSYYSQTCTYLQTNDITLTSTWEHGIGLSANGGAFWRPFQGTYDGGGFAITSLAIDSTTVPTSDQAQQLGFIGLSDDAGAVVRNVNLVNASIRCGSRTAFAGLLVGKTLGNVSRSSATGDVDCAGARYNVPAPGGCSLGTRKTDLSDLGGLIGNIGGTVSNAWVSGTVVAPVAAQPCLIHSMGAIGYAGGPVQNVLARVSLVYAEVGVWVGAHTGFAGSTLSGNFAQDDLNPGPPPLELTGNLTPANVSPEEAAMKSAAELQDIATFTSWSISAGVDTSAVWGIAAGLNGGFPFLQPLPSAPDDPSQVPPPILQQLPPGPGGACTDLDDAAVAYGTGLTGGWEPAWAQWVNGGTGGPVCGRTLVYLGGRWRVES